MPSRTQTVRVSKLLLDESNARLGVVQPDQQSTVLALATKIGSQLLEIAADIVEHGVDPTALLAVTPDGAPHGKFRVIEGNRRLLALKALADPRVVSEAPLSTPARKRLTELSDAFKLAPVKSVECVVFDLENEAQHWIELRHTGSNEGVGLVQWDANEKDRYRSRHGGLENRSAGGQVLDFVDRVYPPRLDTGRRIISTLQRLVLDPDVRSILGIEISAKIVLSNFPADQVARGLSALVNDFRSGAKKVTDVYHKPDRARYLATFGPDRLPDPSTRLKQPVPLAELSLSFRDNGSGGPEPSSPTGDISEREQERNSGTQPFNENEPHEEPKSGRPEKDEKEDGGEKSSTSSKSRAKPPAPRPTLIPPTCRLWITDGRINAIYRELSYIQLDTFPNSASVLLRVFLELSVDHHISQYNLLNENERMHSPLAKRMKTLAAHLRATQAIEEQLERAIVKIADGAGVLNASAPTMNQYVHNRYTYPIPNDLRTAWDELQPFMAVLWAK